MTVNAINIQADGLEDFLKSPVEEGLNVSKKMDKNHIKKPRASFKHCYCSCI